MRLSYKICRCLFFLIVLLLSGFTVYAGDVATKPDGSIVWEAGVDGVKIEWGRDGSLNRIYSEYSHPVEFPDKRGIRKAQIIAEEKAKANIIRFIDQHVSTKRIVTEVDHDFQQSTITRGTGKQSEMTKKNQRTMIENLSEITGSSASGNLRGVIILEQGYNKKEEEAWVKVGISKKTMAASRALKNALQDESPLNSNQSQQLESGIKFPDSKVKKSDQKDW